MSTSVNSQEKRIFIFRHGETDWNRDRRLQGSNDIALNETGRQQALALREYFLRNPVDVFFSSDLERARVTAEIASGDSGIPIHVDSGMRETRLGKAEGLTREEIVEQMGERVLQDWMGSSEKSSARFPEGESKAEHLARLLVSLEKFLKETPHNRIGVASHGGAMRRILHHLRPEVTEPIMVGNCVMYELAYSPQTGLRYVAGPIETSD